MHQGRPEARSEGHVHERAMKLGKRSHACVTAWSSLSDTMHAHELIVPFAK